jgi:hypothetical protein
MPLATPARLDPASIQGSVKRRDAGEVKTPWRSGKYCLTNSATVTPRYALASARGQVERYALDVVVAHATSLRLGMGTTMYCTMSMYSACSGELP